MSFLGPDVTLKPVQRRVWWRRPVPVLAAVLGLVVVVVVVVVVAVVVVRARSDDGGGHRAPRNTGSSQSPTGPSKPVRPSEKPPVLPGAAHEKSEAGIEATVRFEIEALNYAQRTGDFDPLRSVFNMNSCSTCKSLIEGLSASLKNGATYVNAEYLLKSVEPSISVGEDGEPIGFAKVLEIQPKEALLLDRNGKELRRRIEPDANLTFSLKFTSGQWIIQQISGERA
ncbi:MAG TPA: DUF6318 family protein [Mycobacteriales bacterium]|jgi:hypothetical protein|nr:DUF6318 family protein [Mycobacteriales bacterium]